MAIKSGGIRLSADFSHQYTHVFGAGNVATDGVAYSPIASFGTTAVEILNELVNPGFSLNNQSIYTQLTQQFTGLNGSFIGTVRYFWEAREEWYDPAGVQGTMRTGSWLPLMGTFSKSTGTLLSSEDTLSNYLSVGSLPHSPIRVRLTADALQPNSYGRVKNSSKLILVGSPIPGT